MDHPSYDTTTNSSEGGSGYINVGVYLGFFELTCVYRVWSIVHNVNKSCKNSKDNTQTSDDKNQLAYKEMYLGLGYIFWFKLTAWKFDKQSNLCYIMTQFKRLV